MFEFIIFIALFAEVVDYSTVIDISEQTTVITKPIAEDGLPDYEAYLLEKTSKGVTPENNAAALLWEVLWPEGIEEKYQAPMRAALKLNPKIDETPKLIRTHDESLVTEVATWLAELHREQTSLPNKPGQLITKIKKHDAPEVIGLTQDHIWTSKTCPPLGRWIVENERQLDTIVSASKRSRFYTPSPEFLNDTKEGLVEALLPVAQNMRHVTRVLAARAMWHLGEGRSWEAWEDVLASYRLAALMSQGFSLVEQLVAIAMEGVTHKVAIAVLHNGKLSASQLRGMMKTLEEMPMLQPMVNKLDHGERLMYVDYALAAVTGRNRGASALDRVNIKGADYNFVLKDGNQFYDRVVNAAKISDKSKRYEAIKEVEAELAKREVVATQLGTQLVVPFHRELRSKQLSNIILCTISPAVGAALKAEERGQVTRQLTIIAAALAVYRVERQEYPNRLEDLVPTVLSEMPLDHYSGKPFVYRRKGSGYLLYSVYENGEDDNGTDFGGKIVNGEWVERRQDVDLDDSDLVIRMPLPPFKLPAFDTTE
jgi:hypothetical protein